MIKAAIIAIGSELMRGKMDDTNSTFFARWFDRYGVKVVKRINVEDELDAIVASLECCEDCDIILSTGGLGPTKDDLTREGFARYLKKDLFFSEPLWKTIAERMQQRGYYLYESNKQQAFLFEGAEVLENHRGTAPGVFYRNGEQLIFILPGPPSENRIMATERIFPILKREGVVKGLFFSEVFRVYGTGESQLADLFVDKDDGYFEIGYYFSSEGFIELHFRKYSEDGKMPVDFADKVAFYKSLLHESGFFFTEDIPLTELLFSKLKHKNLSISFAESCTGGGVSSELVKVAGVSSVYLGGVVSYSNELKQKVLGVQAMTIQQYGAVSSETVLEMVAGIQKITQSDIAVSVSGIAGPQSDSGGKPAGLVWFGFFFCGKYWSEEKRFCGLGREQVIHKAINYVYMRILQIMDAMPLPKF